MELQTLEQIFQYIVITLGAGGLSVWLLNMASANPQDWFETLSYSVKRIVSMIVASLVVTVVWIAGILLFGYFESPGATWQAWLEAWTVLIAPSIISQQVIHGIVHARELAASGLRAKKAS